MDVLPYDHDDERHLLHFVLFIVIAFLMKSREDFVLFIVIAFCLHFVLFIVHFVLFIVIAFLQPKQAFSCDPNILIKTDYVQIKQRNGLGRINE